MLSQLIFFVVTCMWVLAGCPLWQNYLSESLLCQFELNFLFSFSFQLHSFCLNDVLVALK